MSDPYVELLLDVIAHPTADAPRIAFAEHVCESDAPLARMVMLQVERGQKRRGAGLAQDCETTEEKGLLAKHDERWARLIRKYTISHRFDRGFIEYIAIDPYMFLEYGAWLMKNAPIRSVRFSLQESGPFPMEELAASPLLARLDAVSFWQQELPSKQLEQFVKSPHIGELLQLDLTGNYSLTEPMWDLLAQTPATKKLLSVGGFTVSSYPGEHFVPDDWGGHSWEPMGERGRALERRYGYLPWLHHEEGDAGYDARYLVNLGKHPLRPVGSPVDTK